MLSATGGSSSGAGGCVAPTLREAWLFLRDLADEKGARVRLDWSDEEQPTGMHDGRAAAAPLAMELEWVPMFSYRFCSAQSTHIESLISFLSRVPREGVRAQRLKVLVDAPVVLGVV